MLKRTTLPAFILFGIFTLAQPITPSRADLATLAALAAIGATISDGIGRAIEWQKSGADPSQTAVFQNREAIRVLHDEVHEKFAALGDLNIRLLRKIDGLPEQIRRDITAAFERDQRLEVQALVREVRTQWRILDKLDNQARNSGGHWKNPADTRVILDQLTIAAGKLRLMSDLNFPTIWLAMQAELEVRRSWGETGPAVDERMQVYYERLQAMLDVKRPGSLVNMHSEYARIRDQVIVELTTSVVSNFKGAYQNVNVLESMTDEYQDILDSWFWMESSFISKAFQEEPKALRSLLKQYFSRRCGRYREDQYQCIQIALGIARQTEWIEVERRLGNLEMFSPVEFATFLQDRRRGVTETMLYVYLSKDYWYWLLRAWRPLGADAALELGYEDIVQGRGPGETQGSGPLGKRFAQTVARLAEDNAKLQNEMRGGKSPLVFLQYLDVWVGIQKGWLQAIRTILCGRVTDGAVDADYCAELDEMAGRKLEDGVDGWRTIMPQWESGDTCPALQRKGGKGEDVDWYALMTATCVVQLEKRMTKAVGYALATEHWVDRGR